MINFDDKSDDRPSDIFKEAEEMSRSFTNLFSSSFSMIQCSDGGLAAMAKNGKCGFDPDGFDEPIIPDWRRDPSKSLADWTLMVYDGVNSKPYHIHKSVMTFGSRRSMYFIKEFEKANKQERNPAPSSRRDNTTTEVALPKRAAASIPLLLDFIYTDKLKLKTENASSLRFLGNYFDVRELYSLVSSFMQNDLSLKTVAIYLCHADELKDKELSNLSINIAAESFHRLSIEQLTSLPPHTFNQVVSSPQMTCPSELLSEKIALYCKKCGKNINDETFYFLTHAQILPRISSKEAMWFLTFGTERFPTVLVDDSLGGYNGSLKRRCIIAACKEWRQTLLIPISDVVESRLDSGSNGTANNGSRRSLFAGSERGGSQTEGYRNLPADIRAEILEEALLIAANEEAVGSRGDGSGRRE